MRFRIITIFSILLFTQDCRWDSKEGISSNFKMIFGVLSAVEPKVSSVLPKDKSTGNYRNTQIVIILNTDMNTDTLKTALTVKSDQGAVSGDISFDGTKVVTFVPKTTLNSNTTYTITVGTGAKSDRGVSPASALTMTFSTGTEVDTTAPSVANTSPADSSTGFPINAAVSVTFTETINPTSFKSSMFTLAGGSIAGTATLQESTVNFKSSSNLPPNTVIAARIGAGLKDMAGNATAVSYTWIFTTGTKEATVCRYSNDKFNDCLYQ